MYRFALLSGVVGGLSWIGLAFVPPECAPVSETTEVFCNRLWTPPLTLMLIGAVGLWWRLRPDVSTGTGWSLVALAIGFAMMAGGNFGEYWIAFGLPHQGGTGALVRSLLWMTVLAGWLTALIGAVVTGMGLYNPVTGYGRPRLLSLVFLLPLPLTFVFAALGPSRAGIPVGLLGVLTGFYGLAIRYERAQVPR